MKTRIYIFILLYTASALSCFAQEEEGESSVNPKKVAFLTTRLKLTSEQAKAFWPVYEGFDKERKTVRQAIQQLRNNYSAVSSDEDVKNGLQEMATLRQKSVDVEKKYVDKFFKVIQPKQTVELYRAEIDWQDALIGAIQNQTNNGQAQDKILEKKADFLSGKMKLTSAQAKQFWVLYNDLETERKANRQALFQLRKNMGGATDDQVKGILKEILDIRQQGVDTEKKQMDKILKVVSPRQTAALYKGEIEFQRELVKEWRERQQQLKERTRPAETREKIQQNKEKIQDLREKRQNLQEKKKN